MVALVETGSVNPAIPALVSSVNMITSSLRTSSGIRMLPPIAPVEFELIELPAILLVVITLPDRSLATICRLPISRLN